MKLTEEQEEAIRKQFKKTADLKIITRKVFDNDALDGRSLEGRAVRAFLVEEGLKFKTTLVPPVEQVTLTEENIKYLMSGHVEVGMKPIEITRVVFRNPNVEPLGRENRAIIKFLTEHRPEILDEEDIPVSAKWKPPTSFGKALAKINLWTGRTFEEARMPVKDRKSCEQLLIHLKSPRCKHIINQYKSQADRELFEGELIRCVWDKPDLTIDELNLYITVCSNYVRQKHIQRRLDRLNNILSEEEGGEEDVTMRFTELIKATSDELNSCENRIEKLIQKLNGDRAKRLSDQRGNNVSILALVEAFQNYEERERMVKMAQMENALAGEEVDRLESFDEMKARIMGITKRELL